MLTHVKRRIVLLALATALPLAVGISGSRDTRAQPKPAADMQMTNDPVVRIATPRAKVRIVEKFAKIIQLDKRIATVYGFDQEVVTVTKVAQSPNMIRLHAQKPGITSMVLVDENKKRHTVEVFITGDVRHLQAYLSRFFPHSTVEAVAIGDTVVLRGWVTQPEHITEMRQIAERFYTNVLDQMKVGGAQQVMLKVRVIEVQRSKIRRFGFNFFFQSDDGALISTPGSLTPLTSFSTNSAISVTGLADPTVAFSILKDNVTFLGFMEALKEEALLKILAEPELVTTNGRPAEMLAGGEFPVLVPQSLGTTTIEWRSFGVRLKAVPIILGRGRVRLELEPEVSERDLTNSVSVNGLRVPALTIRRVNTQVEMRFGETFMIAGLLSTRTTATSSKIPVLGELPWIGAAFRRTRYEEGETELVILVTPELVAPMDGGLMPRGGPGLFTESPTDRELYFDGRMEVTRYSDHCVGCDPPPFSRSPISGPRLQGVAPLAPGSSHVIPLTPSDPNPSIPPPAPGSRAGYDNDVSRGQSSPFQMPRESATNWGRNEANPSKRLRRPGLIQPKTGLIQPASAESAGRRQG